MFDRCSLDLRRISSWLPAGWLRPPHPPLKSAAFAASEMMAWSMGPGPGPWPWPIGPGSGPGPWALAWARVRPWSIGPGSGPGPWAPAWARVRPWSMGSGPWPWPGDFFLTVLLLKTETSKRNHALNGGSLYFNVSWQSSNRMKVIQERTCIL